MIKFIKEIFTAENFKRTMIYNSLASPNISSSEVVYLTNVLKNMDVKNIDNNIVTEVNTRKVA